MIEYPRSVTGAGVSGFDAASESAVRSSAGGSEGFGDEGNGLLGGGAGDALRGARGPLLQVLVVFFVA